ncbi:hypothetical protein P5G65_12240 [Paenibacillus chondroitinus]|uniref:Uncharacterized protein n=1 Tax=Paenibacillus chondroitinus TaxID=59842 RepID=A0ABU6DA94_9BACL|nr:MULTISPECIES: hypothetical protein [Paenibacillus]MCY9662293.1 hypothetical protein [Paenibacillus anseongense]MEB4794669.1 hypothetical protein [Paenibacillus chondroitinus]
MIMQLPARLDALMVELKKLLNECVASSDIHHIGYEFYRVGRKDADFATTAIHGISAVMFLAQSSVQCARFTYQEMHELGENVANIYMECEFQSGVIAHLRFCPVAGVVVERATVNAYQLTFYAELPIWNAYNYPGRLIHLENG